MTLAAGWSFGTGFKSCVAVAGPVFTKPAGGIFALLSTLIGFTRRSGIGDVSGRCTATGAKAGLAIAAGFVTGSPTGAAALTGAGTLVTGLVTGLAAGLEGRASREATLDFDALPGLVAERRLLADLPPLKMPALMAASLLMQTFFETRQICPEGQRAASAELAKVAAAKAPSNIPVLIIPALPSIRKALNTLDCSGFP